MLLCVFLNNKYYAAEEIGTYFKYNEFFDDPNPVLMHECDHPNIIVYTSKKRFMHRCSFWLPCFDGRSSVGNTMVRSWITGKFIIEVYFDFVGWINQDHGPYLEKYRIK